MKRILFVFSILSFLPSLCQGQWKNVGQNFPRLYGIAVHDSFLFVSHLPEQATDNIIERYNAASGWEGADTGISRNAGIVTNFTSLGPDLFAGIPNFLIYRSTNNGSSWSVIDSIASPIGTNGRYLFAVDVKGISISKDGGTHWLSLGDNLSPYLYAAAGSSVLAVTSNGTYRSIDSGMNWTITPTPPTGLSLSVFAAVNSQMFAGDTGVFRSTDSGLHWTLFGLKNRIVSALASYKTYLFAGTDTGVFMSSDSGVTWRNVSDGLLAFNGYHPDVHFLAILDTTMFAGFDVGENTWAVDYRSIPEMVDTTQSMVVETQPQSDTIVVYPNPSTGMVTVRSGATSILGIQVLNVLGETMLNEPAPHESDMSFDLSKLPSGTYFVRIETPNGSILRKLVRE